jgi:hypothetical protein
MTQDNLFRNQPASSVESELGVPASTKFTDKDLYVLEGELKAAAEAVVKESRKGTTSSGYQKALERYNSTLQKVNKERRKVGLKAVTSVEELDKERDSSSRNITDLQNRLAAEKAIGNASKAKEIEQQIAEAQVINSANVATPKGLTSLSWKSGYTGSVPDMTNSRPILQPDGTITVVDINTNAPIAVGNRPLESVFIVFEEENFYGRGRGGVRGTTKKVDYRNQEELIQQVYSLKKEDRKKLQEEFKKVGLLPKNYNANGELDRDSAFETAFLQAHSLSNQVNYNRLVNGEPLVGIIEAVKEFKSDEAKGPTISKAISEFSISDGQAEALLEEFYTQALGVRPTKNDIDKFKEIVQKRATKKPRITQTTTSADGLTSTSKVLEEGFGAAEASSLARRRAEARPEFAGYQMATTFYDAILQAAGSPARVPGPTE